MADPLDQLDVLIIIYYDSLARRKSVRRTYKPVENPSKAFTNRLIRSFNFECSRRSVASDEPPFFDFANFCLACQDWLRETVLIKVLYQLLVSNFVVSNVTVCSARVATW